MDQYSYSDDFSEAEDGVMEKPLMALLIVDLLLWGGCFHCVFY